MRGILISVGEEGYALSEFEGGADELRAALGGWIEPAPSSEEVTLWVDEEGKFKGRPVNRLAMDVWLRWDIHRCMLVGGDYLVGNCVVTGGTGPDGETLDLPESAHRWIHRVARDAGVAVPSPNWERFGLIDREES